MKKQIDKIREKLRFKKVRSRFLVALISLSVPPIMIIGFVAYHLISDSIIENSTQSNNQQIKRYNERIDYSFNNFIKMTRYILSNHELREILKGDQLSENDIYASFQLQKIISEYLVDQKDIESLCLVDNQFNIVCVGKSSNFGMYEGENKDETIKSLPWYNEMVQAKGEEVFLNYDALNSQSQGNFSIVKHLLNPANGQLDPLGFLIVNIRTSVFNEEGHQSDDSGLIVSDLTQDRKKVIYTTSPQFKEIFFNSSTNQIEDILGEEGYLSSSLSNQKTGWTFTYLIKEEILLKELYQIRKITFGLAAIIAISAVILAIIISNTITNPLRKLKEMMISWSEGETKFTTIFADDEVGKIGETFKILAEQNNELSVNLARSQLKEREAELRVLQAQINPHFLYNTLDSIYWMAVLNDQEDISKMAIALSESFKIILSKGKETIPISEELRHIEHYMTIQNLRYNNRFQFIQDVDPSILHEPILKLLIQPLIENAIYHGLEQKVGPGILTIKGYKDGQMILFEISDNGIGIEDMNAIYSGYGLGNIRERLELYYGKSSIFEIKSKKNEGTTVKIGFVSFGKELEGESSHCR